MKLDILIVDLLVVSLVLVPYLIFMWLGLKQSRHLKNKFLEEAKAHNLDLEVIENWNLNYIGLDKKQEILLFVQRKGEGFSVEKVDLKGLKNSRVQALTNSLKIDEKVEQVLQRVDLELEYYRSGEKKLLCLFDSSISYTEDYEFKNAEKWSHLINSGISLKPVLTSAA